MLTKLPIDRIEIFIQLEPYIFLGLGTLGAWFFYTAFLKKISARRHTTLKRRFVKTLLYLGLSAIMAGFHWFMADAQTDYYTSRFVNFMGLTAFIVLVSVAIRIAQIFVYLYLFFSNLRTGVPRLVANLFTLLFSCVLIAWLAAEVFNFHIATVLTTSAIFTIVLGLALQDTLGNLFSGVALQIERPFQIDDWVEIQSGGETWTGQVYEVTWRATSLVGFTDQLIVIPNKTLSQSQITIFSHHYKTPLLTTQFRLRFETNVEEAKKAILEALRGIDEVLLEPPPRVYLTEVNEHHIIVKVFYSLRDYGKKIEAGDHVISSVLEVFQSKGIKTGTNIIRGGSWQEEAAPTH
jgi:small-conductance mechanosensitive channel